MSGPPKISYLICTTPRSGSTLLCELLADTGIAGRPDEYFQQLRSTGLPMRPRDYLDGVAPEIVPAEAHDGESEQHNLYDPYRFFDFDEYVGWVKARATTPNGVFAAKIMWPYMAGLVDGLSTIPCEREKITRTSCWRQRSQDCATCGCAAWTRCARQFRCGARCRPGTGALTTRTKRHASHWCTASRQSTTCAGG